MEVLILVAIYLVITIPGTIICDIQYESQYPKHGIYDANNKYDC